MPLAWGAIVPVNLLLCEGGPGSPDVRVLRKLLAGYCEVRPAGSKYGMGTSILAHREAIGERQIAGLLDGDFPASWERDVPPETPVNWESSDQRIRFGWRWARKEVENYLVDPDVVSRSLGEAAPPAEQYRRQLDAAAERIAVYQAARTALSNCRRRFQPLPASWGPERGRDKHPFPDDLSGAACREGIQRTVAAHLVEQVSPEEVMRRYDELLPEFAEGGIRRRSYAWLFAGKNLLLGMESDLVQLRSRNAGAFREKVLLGIENTSEDIATWVPEWAALRASLNDF